MTEQELSSIMSTEALIPRMYQDYCSDPSLPPAIPLTPPLNIKITQKGETVIAPIVVEALRVAPNTDITMALIRKSYPSVVLIPDMDPDQIIKAISELTPSSLSSSQAAPPLREEDTISVSVNCTMTEERYCTMNYNIDYDFDDAVDVPIDIVADGETSIVDWIKDWWEDHYFDVGEEGDRYCENEGVVDSTNETRTSRMSINTEDAIEEYTEDHEDE